MTSYDKRRYRLAAVMAEDLIQQNPMLEPWKRSDTGAVVGVYDSYDNKFYDLRETADAVLRVLDAPEV